MQNVLFHVTAGPAGLRCELRRDTAGAWRPVAWHDLPDATGLPAGPDAAGAHLAGLLLRADTRRAWEELRDANPGGLRTLVQVDPPALRRLPWELLAADPAFAPGPRRPVAMARDLADGPPHDDVRLVLPLRLLALVADPADVPEVERTIARAGRHVDADVLVAPTQDALVAAYIRMRPHVVHAFGDPGLDPRPAPHEEPARAPMPRLVVLDRLPEPGPVVDPLLDSGACAVLVLPEGGDGATSPWPSTPRWPASSPSTSPWPRPGRPSRAGPGSGPRSPCACPPTRCCGSPGCPRTTARPWRNPTRATRPAPSSRPPSSCSAAGTRAHPRRSGPRWRRSRTCPAPPDG
ncbi:hypothetical protein BJF78_10720 [Pseudonocardia sp. CNS-139]|nr:hypothetical protein BJF78_10720 [Pseudonocardia sp. CNS-139]